MPDPEVVAIAEAVEWPHGDKNVLVHGRQHGNGGGSTGGSASESTESSSSASSAVRPAGKFRTIWGSWTPRTMHELAIIFEEDVEVSRHYYEWLKYTTLAYRYDPAENLRLRNGTSGGAMLYGVSLYTPRWIEVREAQRLTPWNPRRAPQLLGESDYREGHDPSQANAYLHHLPCGRGAVFFPEFWMEFKVGQVHY